MRRCCSIVVFTTMLLGSLETLRAADPAAQAVIDKAIKALGGEARLTKAAICQYKAKGKIVLSGFEGDVAITVTLDRLERRKAEFEGEFAGNRYHGITVVDGDKGWRKFAEMGMPLDTELLANEKRLLYMQSAMLTVVPLNGSGFRVESAGEDRVGDQPATLLKVTGPDGKDFKIWFDKVSGLPKKWRPKSWASKAGKCSKRPS